MAGFALPPMTHPAREAMGDLATVAEILNPANLGRLREFSRALSETRAHFPKGAKSVNVICLRADDERWLIAVGPRGGWKKLWNFGTGR